MARFYERLREGDPPAVALAAAQEHLGGLSPEEAADEPGGLQEAVADDLERDATRWAPRSATDFWHPRHWGAMIAIG
jgi:CHAT domain-containing protein